VNIAKFPDLNQVPEGVAIPAQLIVGYGQMLSIKLLEIEGSSIQERSENFSKDVMKFTRETFQKINCKDLAVLIENNRQGERIFVYFGSLETLNEQMKHLHEAATYERFNFQNDKPV